MGKRIVYTKVTPLPSQIPRQLALDMLHSHGEVISLNPLVTGHKPISAPRDAAADEFFAQWYEIMEIITWGFGMKKKISFKGCFHDLPNGLQTHTYAPMGVDLRNKWTVRGNQPGEPREPRELGLDTPAEGLYLREDVEIVCNIAFTSFVKKEMKAAAGVMVDRLTRKAELLDEGVLHAMFQDGKLRTVNPNVQHYDAATINYRESDMKSPAPSSPGTQSSPQPTPSEFEEKKAFGSYHDITGHTHRTSYLPAYQQSGYQGSGGAHSRNASMQQAYGGAEKATYNLPPVEVEGSFFHPQQLQQHAQPNAHPSPNAPAFRAELPDTSIAASQLDPTPAPLQPRRASNIPSPQPSPALVNRRSISNNSSQPLPPPPPTTPQRTSAASYKPYDPADHSPQSVRAQQASPKPTYALTNPDESFYSNGTPSHRSHPSGSESAQTQGLGIATRSEAPAFGSATALSKCPVCGTFEGDETAVSHHVAEHFS